MDSNCIGKLRIRNINELIDNRKNNERPPFYTETTKTPVVINRTPPKKTLVPKNTLTTSKKNEYAIDIAQQQLANKSTTRKKAIRSNKKEIPSNQMLIDNFFKSTSKTYKAETALGTPVKGTKKCTNKQGAKINKKLFDDDCASSSATESSASVFEPAPKTKARKKVLVRKQPQRNVKKTPDKLENINAIIDLCSDDDNGFGAAVAKIDALGYMQKIAVNQICVPLVVRKSSSPEYVGSLTPPSTSSKANSTSNKVEKGKTTEQIDNVVNVEVSISPKASKKRKRAARPCPPYKIIEGTTFAVDAFQFGAIPNVTHYFLTHYHADHYVGLTKTFSYPLYTSAITARLLRSFIPIEEQYLHELTLNQPIILNDIEITALDANHCPGAIMIAFKFLDGRCILHTGDFRASPDMESEPIFWNNDISALYLDTTYLSVKYDFCSQFESISKAIDLVEEFQEKHAGKRILYVCGSYVIGKEKIWSALALRFDLNVWTEQSRMKALEAINMPDLYLRLVKRQEHADLHVIPMGKLRYQCLVEYFETFMGEYDLLLAIRPSGWEQNSKPQYRGCINIIGIEYSEHSSYKELERFVKFIKPERVISTVPVERDLFKTGVVPEHWYKYKGVATMLRNYQPTITSYLKTPSDRSACFNDCNNLKKTTYSVKKKITPSKYKMKISPCKAGQILMKSRALQYDNGEETNYGDNNMALPRYDIDANVDQMPDNDNGVEDACDDWLP